MKYQVNAKMKKYLILNTKYLLQKRRSGFTMIELMVVLAISVTISIASFVAFSNVSSSKSVKNTLDEMEALVTAARKKSISQETGARWGVRVENTDSSKRVILFSGVSYASGTPSNFYSMKRNVVLTNPVASTTYDAIFDPITGFLSEKKVFTVATLKKDGIIGDLIVNTIGAVTQRYDYGLVGYWHFDEGTGTSTYDASGIGNNGTFTNGPTWQTSANCKAGTCLSFNGTSDFIQLSALQPYKNAVTISAWVYHNSSGDWDDIVAGGCGDLLFGFSNNYLSFGGQCNTPMTMTTYLTNINSAWRHVAGTYNGTSVFLYVDGQQVASSTKSGSFSTFMPKIGGVSVGSENYTGRIDEVRIYNRALSAAEILAMYNDLK
jgi:prepilin-type N-terminal cleavage/methylation domain-containing protein